MPSRSLSAIFYRSARLRFELKASAWHPSLFAALKRRMVGPVGLEPTTNPDFVGAALRVEAPYALQRFLRILPAFKFCF